MGNVRSRREQQRLEDEMAALCAELANGLGQPAPSDTDQLFDRIAAHLSVRRGRPVRIVRRDLPREFGTVSGLWLDREMDDVIVVVRNTSPLHSLVILGHEIWHMMRGHCGSHVLGVQVTTRLLRDELSPADLGQAVLSVAARTHAVPGDEAEAEDFGRRLGSSLRRYVEHDPSARVLKGTARRIQSSLGASEG
ncbi:toxin-antitoxin system, toxin component [Streptomyces sp. NPDC059496]|uniref:toxin-antitoxin system, toxin component n=1 Tax=Streptomyces sp. NPDC059496 TaxID=3346851 RepID=UPI00367D510A